MTNERTDQQHKAFLREGQKRMIGSNRTRLLRQIRGEGIVETERIRNQQRQEEENGMIGGLNNTDANLTITGTNTKSTKDRENKEDGGETDAKTILDNDDEDVTHQPRLCPNVPSLWQRVHRVYAQTVKESKGMTNIWNLTLTVATSKEPHGERHLSVKEDAGINMTVEGTKKYRQMYPVADA